MSVQLLHSPLLGLLKLWLQGLQLSPVHYCTLPLTLI